MVLVILMVLPVKSIISSGTGVDYVWISPFFKSPQKDFGYDVSDYRSVDKLFGSNDDFKKLLDIFHKKGLKVITDLVLSHTSDEHEWLKEVLNQKITSFQTGMFGKTANLM